MTMASRWIVAASCAGAAAVGAGALTDAGLPPHATMEMTPRTDKTLRERIEAA